MENQFFRTYNHDPLFPTASCQPPPSGSAPPTFQLLGKKLVRLLFHMLRDVIRDGVRDRGSSRLQSGDCACGSERITIVCVILWNFLAPFLLLFPTTARPRTPLILSCSRSCLLLHLGHRRCSLLFRHVVDQGAVEDIMTYKN